MNRIHMAGPWITDHEIDIVVDAMKNGWYENSYHYCEAFQTEFAQYHDRRYGIMTPNCTTAIHLLLTALGVSDGDEVIVPECTWIATAAPIHYLRAKPVFCDIDLENWCLDPRSVQRSITDKTKAVIVVDLYGNMPQMDELIDLLRGYGIPLIEDAAEAIGSTYGGVRAGKFGIGSVFSFHRTKTLTTGEGGMLLVDDEALYRRCMFLRDHGRKPDGPMYFNYEVTYKYMPSNVQAALGYAQFQRIEELVRRKREIFEAYGRELDGIDGLSLNPEPDGVFNGVWCPAAIFDEHLQLTKQSAIDALAELGVPARPFFYPLSSLPAFDEDESVYRKQNPNAYSLSSRGINLPCAMNLTSEQIKFICDAVKKVVGVP